MPTVFMTLKPCFVCGTQGRCPDIGGPGSYHGPRDLDTRPSVSQRSSIYMWVQRCLSCGYCGVDIAQGDPIAKAIVQDDMYRRQLNDPSFSETANSFLCRAMILERLSDWVEAGWACVYAAWVCDDSGFDDSSATCRKRAVSYSQKAHKETMPFAANRGEELVLMADLLRRARQFEDARKLCEVEMSLGQDKRASTLLTYEMDLIEERNSALHTESEGLEE